MAYQLFFGYLMPILLEEQLWDYLTHSWEDKGVHTFPKGICPKVNVIARLKYELAYYDSAVHRFNHYTTRTPPSFVFKGESNFEGYLITMYFYHYFSTSRHTHTHMQARSPTPPTPIYIYIYIYIYMCVCVCVIVSYLSIYRNCWSKIWRIDTDSSRLSSRRWESINL